MVEPSAPAVVETERVEEIPVGSVHRPGTSESLTAGLEAVGPDMVEDDGAASQDSGSAVSDEDEAKVAAAAESEAQAQSAVPWFRKLSTLVFEGTRAVEQVRGKDVVVLLGHTGAGKTALLHFLAGGRLVPQARSSGRVFVPDPHAQTLTGLEDFAVGHERVSKTQALMPFQRPGGAFVYVDCAGSMDTRGDEVDIATAVSLKNVAAAARSVRFVVVISCADLHASRASLLRDTARRLAHLVVDSEGQPDFKCAWRAFTFIFSHLRHLTGSLDWSAEKALRAELVELLGIVVDGTPAAEVDTTRHVLRQVKKCLTSRKGADLFHPEWPNRQRLLEQVESTDPQDRLVPDLDRPLQKRVSCPISAANESKILLQLKTFSTSVDRAFEAEDMPEVQNFLVTIERLKDHIPYDDVHEFHTELRNRVNQRQGQAFELARRLIRQGTGEAYAFSTWQADQAVKCMSDLEALQASTSRGVLMQELSQGLAALAERVATQFFFEAPADPLPNVMEVKRFLCVLGVWAQSRNADADWARHHAAASGSLQGYVEQLLLAAQDVRLPLFCLVAVSVRFRTLLPHAAELWRHSNAAATAAPNVGAETLLQRRILEDLRSQTAVAMELLASAADEGSGQAWEVRQQSVGGFQRCVQDLRAALALFEVLGCEVPALAGPLRNAIGALHEAWVTRVEECDNQMSDSMARGEYGARLHGLLLAFHALANAQDGAQTSHAGRIQYEERVEEVVRHLHDCNSRIREQLEQLPSGELDVARLLERCQLLQGGTWFDTLCPDKAFVLESLEEVRAALHQQQDRDCHEVEDRLRSLLSPAAHGPAPAPLQKLRCSWERVRRLSSVQEFCQAVAECEQALRLQVCVIADEWCSTKQAMTGAEVRSVEDMHEADAVSVHEVLGTLAGLDFLPIQTEEVTTLANSARSRAEQWKALSHEVVRGGGFAERTALLKTLSRWAALELNTLTDGLPMPADLRDTIARAWGERIEQVEAVLRESPDAARAELQRLREECLPPDADEVWRRLCEHTKLVAEKVTLRLENVLKELQESLELLDFAAVKRHLVPLRSADAEERDRCQARVTQVKRRIRLRLSIAKESIAGPDLLRDLADFERAHSQVGDLLKEGPDPLDLAGEVGQLKDAANDRLSTKLRAIQEHLDNSAYAEVMDLLKDADEYRQNLSSILQGRLAADLAEKQQALDGCLGRLAEHVASCVAALAAAAEGTLESDFVGGLVAELRSVRAACRHQQFAGIYEQQVAELKLALEKFHAAEMLRAEGEHIFAVAIQKYSWLKTAMDAGLQDHLTGLSFDTRGVIEHLREKDKEQSRQLRDDLVSETFIVNRTVPLFQKLYSYGNAYGMYRQYYTQDFVRNVDMLNKELHRHLVSSSEMLRKSTCEGSGNNLFNFLVLWKHLHKYAQAHVNVTVPAERILEDFRKLLQEIEQELYLLTNVLVESLRVGFGRCSIGVANELTGSFFRYSSFVLHIIRVVSSLRSADLTVFPFSVREPVRARIQAYPHQLARCHEALAAFTSRSWQDLAADLDACDYKKATASARVLRDLVQFLACPFAAYRESLQDLQYPGDPHLVALDTQSEELGAKRLAEVGKHYAVLQVMPGAPMDEIKTAYKYLSRQSHPDKQAKQGVYRLDPDASQRRLNAAHEALTKTYATRDWRAELDALFDKTVSRSLMQLQSRIREHLGEGAYTKVRHLLEAMGALDEFSAVCRLQMPVAHIVQRVHKAVRMHVEETKAAVHRLWHDDDLPQLQRQLDKLASISSSLGGYPEMYSDEWRDEFKRGVRANINDFAADAAARLYRGEESMHQFATQLMRLARIFDNLKDFKCHAGEQVNALLELCKGKPGGFAYLFRLGQLLEWGRIGRLDSDGRVLSEDQRLGKLIVNEFSQFRDIVTVTWNGQTEFTHKDVDSTLEGIVCRLCPAGGLPTREGAVGKAQLKAGWGQYKAKYDELFHQWRAGHLQVEQIPAQAFRMVAGLPACSSSSWPKSVKEALPKLIAVIFSYFTISRSGDSYQRLTHTGKLRTEKGQERAPEMVLCRPHSVQILTLLHLLAYDAADESLRSRLMHVRTGEGKSIILGGLSVICAVLGFKVRCVCYSSYMSQRDHKMFEGMFRAFGVKDRVVYSNVTNFIEHRISTKGDIRESTVRMLRGEGTSPAPSRAAAAVAVTGKAVAVGLRPLREDAEELLLIDEVDQFFGGDFYGQTYNVVATLPLEEAVEILEFLWRHKDARGQLAALFHKVKAECTAYRRLLEKLPGWSYLVDGEVRDMCMALRDYDEEPCNAYHYNEDLERIGYKVMDSYDYDVEYGYRTCFAWLAVAEDPGRGLRDETNLLKKALQLRVPCGHFSYANIGRPTILGVSGSITALGSSEWQLMSKYDITGFSSMPSVYGDSNLRIFDQTGNPPLTISAAADHARDIANQAKNTARSGRAVIVFFKYPAELQATGAYLKDMPNVNVLLEVNDTRDKEYVMKKAATSRQITLATAIFGRGTDFFSSDPTLEAAGGVHVIQAFFSAEQRQEVQIQGRTARQGKAGTFAWVLSEEEITAWGLSAARLKTLASAQQYAELKRAREERGRLHFEKLEKRLAEATEKDELTHRYFDALLAGATARARELFKAMYERRVGAKGCGSFSTCRMVCLSEATGSMGGIWQSARTHITEMFRRVLELTGSPGVLELQWVAYRDYCDSGLLEPSGWSDSPASLQQFIDRIVCTGGCDTEKAVEHALEFARNEHRKKPVSRILLIAHAPPHFEKKGQKLTAHSHSLRTDYLEEATSLKRLGVPVFSFVVGGCEKTFSTCQEISRITGGTCEHLKDPAHLLDVVCINALEEIGGSEVVAEHRVK